MKSGLQNAVNACQKALGWFSNRVANLEISLVRNFIGSSFIWNTIEVNGDQKLLFQMFCDDKDSKANAKRIKNQWNKLSWSDKVSVENIHYIYLTSTNFRTEHFFEPICWDGDQVSSFGKLRERPRLTLVSTGLLSTSPSLECFQLTDYFR